MAATSRAARWPPSGLGLAGEWLFVATVVVVVVKLALVLAHGPAALTVLLGLAAALLPVVSAGFFVLRAYAELNVVAGQSTAMLRELAQAAVALDSLDLSRPLASQDLGADGYALASTMLADIEGWARLFRVKVIEAG
jgi:hypothetical protein